MAVGNTFGATALSSYGGFWISFAIVLTPGGFAIGDAYKATGAGKYDFDNAMGFFLAGWFIFTTILLLCTLRSTIAFFLLFFFLDLAFLFLFLGYFYASAGTVSVNLTKTGGYFGLFAAFMAWYNALAGIADDRYVFFSLFAIPFPAAVCLFRTMGKFYPDSACLASLPFSIFPSLNWFTRQLEYLLICLLSAATRSSSSPLHTSPGPRRDVSVVSPPSLSARLFK